MVGRKPNVNPTECVTAVMTFKERVVTENEGKKCIVPASDPVWKDIRELLSSAMTVKAIHLFVYEGRHDIWEKLGLPCVKTPSACTSPQKQLTPNEDDYYSSSINSSDDNLSMPSKKFVITFSADEWKEIHPQELRYKMNDPSRPLQSSKCYYALPKSNWTPVVAEHFWEHTRLKCCLAFRRAKVTKGGNYYVVIVGRCSICQSHFKGTISERPGVNSRVLMNCIYTGNFNEEHIINRKRRMIGPVLKTSTAAVINNLSCESYRERESSRLMKMGDPEPAILPTGNALRIQKFKQIKAQRRHDDSLTALYFMKCEDDFKTIIRDLGCDPFFADYYTSEQIHLYRSYCKHERFPKLIIDATGSVVKQFKKFGLEKTSSIFLYEGVVHDKVAGHSFTALNMLSERHSNLAIARWLGKWCACDVPKPKESVCDNSLALLSALAQSFTQYSSLQDYVRACADLLTGRIAAEVRWIPRCFIRIDIAHFVKIACKWTPLKSTPRRVREVVLRAVGLLIKSQSITEIRSMLLSLFVVLTNETDGIGSNNRSTQCEEHKQRLLQATSTGFQDFQEQFDYILACARDEDEARVSLEQEYDRQNEGLENFENPFQAWADNIFCESKSLIEEGNGINPFFCPSLVKIIIKTLKLLPLWSGVMIPLFGYGEEVASSAAVESSFKKLKCVTFKNIPLPTGIETFVENHILSLKGASLIRAAVSHSELQTISPERSIKNICGDDNIMDALVTPTPLDMDFNPTKILSPISEIDVLPTDIEADHSVNYKLPVHELNTCSSNENDSGDSLVDFLCLGDTNSNLDDEATACERWNRKSKRQRNNNSYLLPNPHLRHLDLTRTRNIKSLPILKNGSRAEELKACNVNELGKVVLTNTCAFDSITSILMAAYCDSQIYCTEVDKLKPKNILLEFVENVIKNGITAATYVNRANLMVHHLNPPIQIMSYETSIANCDATMGNIINIFLKNIPTINEIIKCSDPNCKKPTVMPIQIPYITINIKDDNLNELEEMIDRRVRNETSICGHVDNRNSPCTGYKTISPVVSKLHIFIELLYWNDDDINSTLQSTEAAPQILVALKNIPEILKLNGKTYELRGVCSFQRGLSRLRNTVGHFTAYCKRGNRNWELIDDLKKKMFPVKSSKKIPAEFLVYTI